MDVAVGNALDIFGGDFAGNEVVAWQNRTTVSFLTENYLDFFSHASFSMHVDE